jgi:hypothetical protein
MNALTHRVEQYFFNLHAEELLLSAVIYKVATGLYSKIIKYETIFKLYFSKFEEV